MHISDVFAERRPTFSFEFFPPKSSQAAADLFDNVAELEALRPQFVSVTYGAGGSTRELTRELVRRIKTETLIDPIPHLTSVRHNEREISEILSQYCELGVSNVLALRGDPPAGDASYSASDDAFEYASELVAFVRGFGEKHHADRRGFGIGVAGFPEGHPGCPNRVEEIEHLRAKVDAGADYICTQLFFDNRDFYDFRDRCRLAGIGVPILAGIMPITSMKGMARMAELALGARYPAALLRALNRTSGEAESVRRVGVHWATEQCRDLLDHGVDGIHFYTLNKSKATREIYATLGVQDSRQLRA
ncbi:MAG: methylenetetrahydrofolate reductase [NAD(P)H] [Planctomycetota bacterium]